MNLTRVLVSLLLCAATLLLWGCAEEPADDPMPVEPPGSEIGNNTPPPPDQAPAENDNPGADGAAAEELSGELRDGTRVVEVEARRFEFVPGVIMVRSGEPVRLEVTATDVAHGLHIEALEIDRRLPPNEMQAVEFTLQEPGEYPFHCSVYCGAGHSEMRGVIVAR